MKVLQTFTLDYEVVIELKKEKNKSALINSYLRSYFGFNETEEALEEKRKEKEMLEKNEKIKQEMQEVF